MLPAGFCAMVLTTICSSTSADNVEFLFYAQDTNEAALVGNHTPTAPTCWFKFHEHITSVATITV